MKKNIIIAGLAVSNLILLAALIYVSAKWSTPPRPLARAGPMSSTPRPDTDTGPQEFMFNGPGQFAGNDAPLILNRALTITATFDTQEKDGVIIAQGGLVHGYALYVENGELWFALRRLSVLTTVSGGKVSAGPQSVTATLSKAGASRRIDELLNKSKGGSASAAPSRRPRKTAAAKAKKATAPGAMSEAQSAYLQELAEEEGGDFDPDLTKEEGARRIGELLVKQMARRSPTEPPF